MENKIKKYFSIVQNYYESQSKYFDTRIEIHKQTKKLIDLSRQIMTLEQDKELKKLELNTLKTKSLQNEKDKERKSKLETQLKGRGRSRCRRGAGRRGPRGR